MLMTSVVCPSSTQPYPVPRNVKSLQALIRSTVRQSPTQPRTPHAHRNRKILVHVVVEYNKTDPSCYALRICAFLVEARYCCRALTSHCWVACPTAHLHIPTLLGIICVGTTLPAEIIFHYRANRWSCSPLWQGKDAWGSRPSDDQDQTGVDSQLDMCSHQRLPLALANPLHGDKALLIWCIGHPTPRLRSRYAKVNSCCHA